MATQSLPALAPRFHSQVDARGLEIRCGPCLGWEGSAICHCQTVTCLSCGPQLDCTTVQDQGGSQDFNRERTAGAIAKASPIPKRKQEVYEKKWERNEDAFAEDTAVPSAHRYMPVQHFEDRSVGRVDKLTAEGNLRKRPTTGRPPQDGKPIKGSVKYGRGAERGSTQKNTIQGRLQRGSEGRPGFNSLEMLAGSTSRPKKANE
jgi:hypothetical protein